MSGIQVRAKDLGDGRFGYYDDKRRRSGDVFFIKNEKEFSDKWMEKVDDHPEPKKAVAKQITGDPKTKIPVEKEEKRGRAKPSREGTSESALSEEVI